MRALIKEGRSVALREVPAPEAKAGEVLVRVAAAGICRSDLYVAEGRIPSRDPLILGHEMAGVVAGLGAGVSGFAAGDRVTVMPALPCSVCAASGAVCGEREMLGVRHHGAFAEYVAVPSVAVFRLPSQVSFAEGAYAEPVAASLAVLSAGITPQMRGMIWGTNRIARLTLRVLEAHGFAGVTLFEPGAGARLEAGSFDFAIETAGGSDTVAELVRAVRPRGRIVIKSRRPEPVAIDFSAAIAKDLTFAAVGWGELEAAVALIAERRVEVGDLLGRAYPLEQFEAAFRDAAGESSKPYFAF